MLEEDYEFAREVFDIQEEGNWEENKNVLRLRKGPAQYAEDLNIQLEQFWEQFMRTRSKLFEARAVRVRPALDDKTSRKNFRSSETLASLGNRSKASLERGWESGGSASETD